MSANLGRRQFLEKSTHGTLGMAILAATATTEVFFASGCSVEADILAWVKIGSGAIGSIIGLLVTAGVIACATCSVAANLAVAAINAIGTAVNNWENAPAASKATLVGKITTALQDALSAATTFFESITLPTGDQQLVSLVEGLVSLVVNAISGFIGQLGGGTTAPAAQKKQVRLNGKVLSIVPKVTKAAQFKSDFNKLLTQYGHGELQLH